MNGWGIAVQGVGDNDGEGSTLSPSSVDRILREGDASSSYSSTRGSWMEPPLMLSALHAAMIVLRRPAACAGRQVTLHRIRTRRPALAP